MRSRRGYGSGGFTFRSRRADYQNPRFFFMISGGFGGKNRKKSDFSLDIAPKNVYNYSSRWQECVGVNWRNDDNSPADYHIITVGCNDTGIEHGDRC